MSTSGFRTVVRLGLTTAVLMFGLIVIGSVVRTTGSGLACPDWPLCEGRLIPRAEPHVLIEWTHRLVALLVSLLLFVTVGWIAARRDTRARLGGLATLAVGLLFAQVLLGALTVWKLLHPSIVSSHLAVALLLFATLLTITLVAQREVDDADAGEPLGARPPGLLPLTGLTLLLAYGQCLLGGLVSTTGAGTACPDWPRCNGQWFPSLTEPGGLQMLHRWGAYALVVALLLLAVRSRSAPDSAVRGAAMRALGLVFAQIALGVSTVLLGTPPWLSAAHLATATAILAMLVILTFRVASLAAPGRALATAEAR
jgi:heme a synthase